MANLTLIEGSTGWIVVDPLTSRENAAAAIAFARQHLSNKPVSAINSHIGHFGGVLGVITLQEMVERKIPVIAPDGFMEEALAQLKLNPDIRLVITDYHMPVMDGFQLTGEIRKQFPMGEIGIIGASAVGNPILSAQFFKTGANDFVNKTYNEEEFQWRIHQNISSILTTPRMH